MATIAPSPRPAAGQPDQPGIATIAVAHGDGIGPEIMDATLRVLEAAGARPKATRNNPKAAVPGKAMAERAAKKAAKAAEPAAE